VSAADAAEAFRYLVRGRVQGVGFRWFVLREANHLQLTGYVRNLPDGAVEVCAQGSRHALAALERKLNAGPVAAHVERVEKQAIPHEMERFKSFEIS
jgi:acylphosphatase